MLNIHLCLDITCFNVTKQIHIFTDSEVRDYSARMPETDQHKFTLYASPTLDHDYAVPSTPTFAPERATKSYAKPAVSRQLYMSLSLNYCNLSNKIYIQMPMYFTEDLFNSA